MKWSRLKSMLGIIFFGLLGHHVAVGQDMCDTCNPLTERCNGVECVCLAAVPPFVYPCPDPCNPSCDGGEICVETLAGFECILDMSMTTPAYICDTCNPLTERCNGVECVCLKPGPPYVSPCPDPCDPSCADGEICEETLSGFECVPMDECATCNPHTERCIGGACICLAPVPPFTNPCPDPCFGMCVCGEVCQISPAGYECIVEPPYPCDSCDPETEQCIMGECVCLAPVPPFVSPCPDPCFGLCGGGEVCQWSPAGYECVIVPIATTTVVYTTEEATTKEQTTEQVSTPGQTTEEQTTVEVTTPEQTTEAGTTPEQTTEEATTPEVTTEEATTPEVTTEEATTPEVTTEEATTPEVTTEEATTPEVTTEDITTPEQSTEETTAPEQTTEETTTPDQTTDNATTPDQTTEIATTPYQTTEETTTPELTTEETTSPEQTTEEATTPDQTTENATTPYQTTDESTTPEMTTDETTTPEQTTEETTTPVQTTEETTTLDQSTEKATTPDQTTENLTTPDQTTENATTPDQTTENATTPDQTTENATTPDQTTENATTPDQTTENTTTPYQTTDESTTPELTTEDTTTPGQTTRDGTTAGNATDQSTTGEPQTTTLVANATEETTTSEPTTVTLETNTTTTTNPQTTNETIQTTVYVTTSQPLPCNGSCDPTIQECINDVCECLVPFPPLPGEICRDPCFDTCDDATEVCTLFGLGYECVCRPGFVDTGNGCEVEQPPLPCDGLCDPTIQECINDVCECLVPFPPPPGQVCQDPCFGACNDTTEICTQLGVGFECLCRPGYFDAGSGCQATASFIASLEIESVNGNTAYFIDELNDKESDEFTGLAADVTSVMDALYGDVDGYYGSGVLGFRPGSIIPDINLYFSATTDHSEEMLAAMMEEEMKINGGSLVGQSSEFSVSSFNVTPTDECALGMDDCSAHADCTDLGTTGFNCTCKSGYEHVGGRPEGTNCQPSAVTTNEPNNDDLGNDQWMVIVISMAVFLVVILLSTILTFLLVRKRTSRKVTLTSPELNRRRSRSDRQSLADKVFPWHEPPPMEYVYQSSILDELTVSELGTPSKVDQRAGDSATEESDQVSNRIEEITSHSEQATNHPEDDLKASVGGSTRRRKISGIRVDAILQDLLEFVSGPQMRASSSLNDVNGSTDISSTNSH